MKINAEHFQISFGLLPEGLAECLLKCKSLQIHLLESSGGLVVEAKNPRAVWLINNLVVLRLELGDDFCNVSGEDILVLLFGFCTKIISFGPFLLGSNFFDLPGEAL